MSTRKPYNDRAGYIASRRNNLNRGWVVIYLACEQEVDVGSNKYAVVCELHSTVCGVTSVANARPLLKVPDFCETCMLDTAPESDGTASKDISKETDSPETRPVHALGVEYKLSGDIRLSCSCGNWRLASMSDFEDEAVRNQVFREHLLQERILPIDSDLEHLPLAGDVIRLVGEEYDGVQPGELAVLGGIVGRPESRFLAAFRYNAFRGRPSAEAPDWKPDVVDCSGGPFPFVHVQHLRCTGETTQVTFWKWAGKPRASERESYEMDVPVWEWDVSAIYARGMSVHSDEFRDDNYNAG